MIYAMLFVVYVQTNLDIRIQSVEARGMFQTKAACDAAADPKRVAFAITQPTSQPAWRDVQCVPVPTTAGDGRIASGMEGL